MEVVKIGPKGRHVQIPAGWHRVTEGVCQLRDTYLDLFTFAFAPVDDDDVGLPASAFDLLIRKDPT